MHGRCGMHGRVKEAFKIFDWMHEKGVQLDDVTFHCLLSTCSHTRLVDETTCCYTSMIRVT
jgi:pentatricopeptide repeat protein